MKRICIVDYDMSVTGGVEQVTAALVNSLCEKYEVWLISLCMTGSLRYELDERINFVPILDHDPGRKRLFIKALPKVKRIFKENKIDVAIIQGNYSGFVTSPLRLFSKTKLVFCDHGALMNQWDNRKIVTMRRMASKLCHKTVALTEQSRMDYIKMFNLAENRVECIGNWIDLEIPRSEAYNTASKRIVSAGRFGKEKGFDMLVKAYAPVAKKHPDWNLDIFGDGEMMDTVKSLIEEYGISENVELLGMRSDLYERYRDYALYVLPSYREGMPLVLLEAKANRLPIVSFDIMTGPREIVRDGIDGILVQPYDLEKMGEAICCLIEDAEKRALMSERSQETLDKFSKETILNQWINLIENI